MPLITHRLRQAWETVAKAADPALLSQAEALAAKYELPVAAAIKNVLDASADAIDLQALVDALQTGDVSAVLAVISQAQQQAAASSVLRNALQDAAWAGGAAAARQITPQLGGAEFHFDRLNPVLIDWLREYDLGLIRQIDDPTKEAIRDVLSRQMAKGESIQRMARQIKDTVGLTPRQAAAVTNFRKELETFHTKRTAGGWKLGSTPDKVHGQQVFKPNADGSPKDGVLERRLRDFRFDKTLSASMTTGKPLAPAQIDKMVAGYARKYRAYRARTIARTESLRATNVGVQDGWRQAIQKGLISEEMVRRKWIVAHDERLCPVCSAVPRMNPPGGVKFGQPFASPDGPIFLPPMHPACRCSVFLRIAPPLPS